MTVLWIFCSLFLLVSLALLLPVDICLSGGSERKFCVQLRILGISVGRKKKRTKPFRKSPEKNKTPILQTVKKLLGLPDSAESFDTLRDAMTLVIALLKRSITLFKKFRIKKCCIHAVSGGSDAAIDYGKTCAVVYPLVTLMQANHLVRQKNLDVDIGWDYEAKKSLYELDFILRFRIFHALRSGLAMLKDFLLHRKNKNQPR